MFAQESLVPGIFYFQFAPPCPHFPFFKILHALCPCIKARHGVKPVDNLRMIIYDAGCHPQFFYCLLQRPRLQGCPVIMGTVKCDHSRFHPNSPSSITGSFPPCCPSRISSRILSTSSTFAPVIIRSTFPSSIAVQESLFSSSFPTT